ncbi:unnamed protein product [Clavelina lepadiformis]|uniref:Uncharacterized protein n=1 Tax=Clavelina lepadiformis TaxID=159417 RepID=A0ABP0GP01_CLALP
MSKMAKTIVLLSRKHKSSEKKGQVSIFPKLTDRPIKVDPPEGIFRNYVIGEIMGNGSVAKGGGNA